MRWDLLFFQQFLDSAPHGKLYKRELMQVFLEDICKHDPTTHRPVFLNEKQHNGNKTTIRPASLAMQGGLLI